MKKIALETLATGEVTIRSVSSKATGLRSPAGNERQLRLGEVSGRSTWMLVLV